MAVESVRPSVARFGIVVASAFANASTTSAIHAQRVAVTTPAPALQRVTVDADDTPLALILRVIAQQAGLVPAFNDAIFPANARISVHVHDMRVDAAFQRALEGTGLVANMNNASDVVIVRQRRPAMMGGTIVGRVIDAKTTRPVRGAKIGLDGADHVTETADDGHYRLANLSTGVHAITVKLLGYTKATHTITVQENTSTPVDFALEISAAPLGQVIVTGTVIPTEVKALPNTITVVTAREIETRGITRIEQLFRGAVPGVIAMESGGGANNVSGQVLMYSRGASSLSFASYTRGNPLVVSGAPAMKTYIDGVELRDPSYLNTIDVKSIDRVEIIPGPQASTIYGSGALGGVIQIFTKHGEQHAKPRLTISTTYGTIQNNFSSRLAPQHDDAVQLEGGEGSTSYTLGTTYHYTGQWNPGQIERTVNAYGSLRYVSGPVTTTGTFRTVSRMIRTALAGYQVYNRDIERGLLSPTPFYQIPNPQDNLTPQQTFGLTFDVGPTPWWTQTLTFGEDQGAFVQQSRAPVYQSPRDTLLTYSRGFGQRTSLASNGTLRFALNSVAMGSLAIGADHWRYVYDNSSTMTPTLQGSIGAQSASHADQWNNGAFMQGQLSLYEKLYFTAGLRAEQSNTFGRDVGVNYAPRYGLSLIQNWSADVTMKLRGAYGSATRPPVISQKLGSELFCGYVIYGAPCYQETLKNNLLQPERQHGSEFGVELYWGNALNISLTRYDQRVTNMITNVSPVDSVYETEDDYWDKQDQYVNVGKVRNDGWEGVALLTMGAWNVKGTWSNTRSRIVQVGTQGVGSQAAQQALRNTYPPGSQLLIVPEHTASVRISYAHGRHTATLETSVIGEAINVASSEAAIQSSPLSRTPFIPRATEVLPRWYTVTPSYAKMDLNIGHTMTRTLALTITVKNLTNYYRSDQSYVYPTQGRISQIGLRKQFSWFSLTK